MGIKYISDAKLLLSGRRDPETRERLLITQGKPCDKCGSEELWQGDKRIHLVHSTIHRDWYCKECSHNWPKDPHWVFREHIGKMS